MSLTAKDFSCACSADATVYIGNQPIPALMLNGGCAFTPLTKVGKVQKTVILPTSCGDQFQSIWRYPFSWLLMSQKAIVFHCGFCLI